MRESLMSLDYESLKRLVVGDAVAIRGTATLEPAGGPGDKIFPPSHAIDDNNKNIGAKYAFENRRIDGRDIKCVLVDSVQSQANRMEESLESLWVEKRLVLPVISVDFSRVAPELGRVTSLTAPHRIADALLRDSLLGDQLFRLSTLGRSFTDASTKNASALFKVCPTGLVFGLWDSTGPKGAQGAKFQRSLVSEIVGVNASPGSKTSSRIDPAQFVNAAATLYRMRAAAGELPTWTASEEDAERGQVGKEANVALKWGAKRKTNGWEQGDGKLTTANHSNIPPTIDQLGGGVTIDEARHTVVLSLASLRRLGFATGGNEARSVLAALALVAVLAAESRGHDLRSRCLLVPRKGCALKLEVVARDGNTTALELDLQSALSLYNEAVNRLPHQIAFEGAAGEPIALLTPSPKLEDLLRRSREIVANGADVGDE
jgi:CRISPR-associated protein Csb1